MQPLFHQDDIPEDTAKGFEAAGKSYFAVKKDGQLHIYENQCPHLGVDLNWREDQFLDPDGALIQCATHGALFLIEDGHCVAGPCLGQFLTAVPFRNDNGMISLYPETEGTPA